MDGGAAMNSTVPLITRLSLLLFGMFAFQACFLESRDVIPANGYSSYITAMFKPASAPSGYEVGDWDENHEWHNRDWWVKNHRPWVALNHPAWLASPSGRNLTQDKVVP
jgi:hypothetical protein